MEEDYSSETTESHKRQSSNFHIEVSQLQERNFENFMDNTARFNISNLTTSTIISTIPKSINPVSLPQNSSVGTYVVNRSNNQDSNPLPSTSTTSATVADHEYVKVEKPEGPINIFLIRESQAILESDIHNILQDELETIETKSDDMKRCIEDGNIWLVSEEISKVHSEHCCSICRDTLQTILQRQEEILDYLKNKPPYIFKEIKCDLLPFMPFNDLNDFLDFDESLSNETVLTQLIAKLQRLLVNSDKKSVANIMASIMTNELCKNISWIGIKDTIAFQNTGMVNHIIDVLQSHHGHDVDTIKGLIAEWLRRCSDRMASEARKNKKKAQ